MARPSHKRTITPAEFAHYAAVHEVEVIYPAPYQPQTKAREERQVMSADAILLPIAKQYAAALEYLIRCDRSKGDDEGANLKGFTLAAVQADIARVEGDTTPETHASAPLAGRRYRLHRDKPIRL